MQIFATYQQCNNKRCWLSGFASHSGPIVNITRADLTRVFDAKSIMINLLIELILYNKYKPLNHMINLSVLSLNLENNVHSLSQKITYIGFSRYNMANMYLFDKLNKYYVRKKQFNIITWL